MDYAYSASTAAADITLFQAAIAALPAETLSSAETANLLRLREEEKLARDVYARLVEVWQTRSFENITRSEQAHMSFVKTLLDRYGLADPAANDGRGLFTSSEFAMLYSDLTAKGSLSYLDALAVGLLIEELDIKDLKAALASMDNQDGRILLLNLEKGSRNHFRAYYRQFLMNGGTYVPTYLGAAEATAIVNSSDRGTGLITDPNYVF